MDVATLPNEVGRGLRAHGRTDELALKLRATINDDPVAAARSQVMCRQYLEDAAWVALRGPAHPSSRAGLKRAAVKATNARVFAETRLRMAVAARDRVAA